MAVNHKKVTQALNWLAKKEGGGINKMKAIKLVWLADRLHLREYGRPITNDDYFAMKLGPVGSVTRNITDEAAAYLSDEQLGYSQRYLQKTDDNTFASINDVDASVFSQSDLETLERVYGELGGFDQFELAKATHEFPEWKKFQDRIEAGLSQASMSYNDFFENPDTSSALLSGKFKAAKDLFEQTPDTIAASKEAFKETLEIRALWS